MDDDEGDFMGDDDFGGDDEDFGGDYNFDDDDNDAGDDAAMEMEQTPENLYYQSKNTEEDNPEEAANLLRKVIGLEESRSEYGFKSLKRLVKLMLKGKIPGDSSEILKDFKSVLTYADVVSVNVMEKGVNAVIDLAGISLFASIKKGDSDEKSKALELIEELSVLSADCFLAKKNERAWFRVNLKSCQILFDAGENGNLPDRLARLTEWCELAPGVNDPKKESFLLDVLALQMKLHMHYSDSAHERVVQKSVSANMTGQDGLRRLVSRARLIQSTVPHPRTLGTIHECGGLVMLFEHDWPNAKKEFFHAFKNYDESGSERRVICLSYIVLAALLENTNVRPFETPETKSLITNKDIVPVVELWNAFEDLDVERFEAAVKNAYVGDDFACSFLPLVRNSFQLQKVSRMVEAYSKIKISFIAKELRISEADCEALLAEFILDGHLDGLIDQVQKVLVMNEEGANDADIKYNAMTQWSRQIENVAVAMNKKVIKDD